MILRQRGRIRRGILARIFRILQIPTFPMFVLLKFINELSMRLLRLGTSIKLWLLRRKAYLRANYYAMTRRRRFGKDGVGGYHTVGIVLTEHLGDLIAFQPIATCLKKGNIDTRVIWIVNERYTDVVQMFPDVDYVQSVGSLSEAEPFQARVFDRVVSPHFGGRWFGHCQRRCRNPFADKNINEHNYYDLYAADDGHIAILRAPGPACDVPVANVAAEVKRMVFRWGEEATSLLKHWLFMFGASPQSRVERLCEGGL
jgi:hypothetical protein